MTMSKGAVGNLINRYRAVLKKCHMLNVFGSLAVAGMLVMGSAGFAGAWSSGDKDIDGLYSIDGLDGSVVSFDGDAKIATVSTPLTIEDASVNGIQARIDKKADKYPRIDVTASANVSAQGQSAVSA